MKGIGRGSRESCGRRSCGAYSAKKKRNLLSAAGGRVLSGR